MFRNTTKERELLHSTNQQEELSLKKAQLHDAINESQRELRQLTEQLNNLKDTISTEHKAQFEARCAYAREQIAKFQNELNTLESNKTESKPYRPGH